VIVQRFDQVRIDGVTRTPQGGLRATANLTRTGIFQYQDSKGQPYYELRPRDEVFAPASLATLDTAPLTIGHPSEVNADNWRSLAVGHVIAGTVRENGQFVTAEIAIQDAETAALVERGDLRELSMGYEVDLEMAPGEFEGERYDAIQRNPRYNHVAIGGTDWGRAGRDVRVVLDAKTCSCGRPSLDAMATSVIRTDAPAGDPLKRVDAPTNQDAENTRRDLDSARADNDRLRAERDAANARADKAEAERDQTKVALVESEKKTKADADAFESRVESRVKLVADAKVILGDEFEFKGKSDRDVRIAALTKIDPKFDAKDKSEGYLEARFELAVPAVKKDQDVLKEQHEVIVEQGSNADGDVDRVTKAREEMLKRHSDAWKSKTK
jgi:uncharacterized protein